MKNALSKVSPEDWEQKLGRLPTNQEPGVRSYDPQTITPIIDSPDNRQSLGLSMDLSDSLSQKESFDLITKELDGSGTASQDKDGRWVITQNDGEKHYLQPSDAVSVAKRMAAGIAANPGSTIGSVLGAAFGIPGSALGAFLGSIADTAWDEFAGADRDLADYLKNAGTEGALAFGGDIIGTLLAKVARYGKQGISNKAYDVEQSMRSVNAKEGDFLAKTSEFTPDERALAKRRYDAAQRSGVELSPPEAFGQRQDIAGLAQVHSGNDVRKQAIRDRFTEMAPESLKAYEERSGGAIREIINDQMSQRPAPTWAEASALKSSDASDLLTSIESLNSPEVNRKVRSIRRGFAGTKEYEDVFPNIKVEALQDFADLRESVAQLNPGLAKEITGFLDEASQGFGTGRKTWDGINKPVRDMLGNEVSTDKTAAQQLFGNSPAIIAKTRSSIDNPESFDLLGLGYLKKEMAEANTIANGETGQTMEIFKNNFWSNESKARFKAGVSPELFQSVDDLMVVLDAISKSPAEYAKSKGFVDGFIDDKIGMVGKAVRFLTSQDVNLINKNTMDILQSPYKRNDLARLAASFRKATGNAKPNAPVSQAVHGLSANVGQRSDLSDVYDESIELMFGNQEEVK